MVFIFLNEIDLRKVLHFEPYFELSPGVIKKLSNVHVPREMVEYSILTYNVSVIFSFRFVCFFQVEQLLLDRKVDKEYAGILGYDFFRKEAYKLAFGEDQNFKENCVRDKNY